MAARMDSASKTGYDTAELKSCPIALYPLADEWNETEWLHAAARNPAFQYLKDAAEDIYTVTDGEPFRDQV